MRKNAKRKRRDNQAMKLMEMQMIIKRLSIKFKANETYKTNTSIQPIQLLMLN